MNEKMAKAFNEWMLRYTQHPEQFSHDWEDVVLFLSEREAGKEPSYGDVCSAYLEKLMAEI